MMKKIISTMVLNEFFDLMKGTREFTLVNFSYENWTGRPEANNFFEITYMWKKHKQTISMTGGESKTKESSLKFFEKKAIAKGWIKPKIGYFFNFSFGSDTEAYKVVAVSPAGKMVTCKKLEGELINGDELNFVAGGFSAHCTNSNIQKYKFTEVEGSKHFFHFSKDGFGEGRGTFGDEPIKFYDYNF